MIAMTPAETEFVKTMQKEKFSEDELKKLSMAIKYISLHVDSSDKNFYTHCNDLVKKLNETSVGRKNLHELIVRWILFWSKRRPGKSNEMAIQFCQEIAEHPAFRKMSVSIGDNFSDLMTINQDLSISAMSPIYVQAFSSFIFCALCHLNTFDTRKIENDMKIQHEMKWYCLPIV